MTELTDKFKRLYDKYANIGSGPRKRSFGELFKGWFSGKGREALPVDTEFMACVEEQTDKIRDEGDAEDAYNAVLLILSKPDTKKFSEQDIVYAAMYKNAIKLVPKIPDTELARVNEAMDKVPKQYRFPVYKELKEALKERSETQK
ncbi:MAG: hypothetical protein IKQ18_07245 [Clostridia bacterium]|nr:hypothetical protein [Clostridia bacterium]